MPRRRISTAPFPVVSSTTLTVTLGGGKRRDFPFVWLRDNCQCPRCFHPVSKARLVLLGDVCPDVRPKAVEVDGDNGNV